MEGKNLLKKLAKEWQSAKVITKDLTSHDWLAFNFTIALLNAHQHAEIGNNCCG